MKKIMKRRNVDRRENHTRNKVKIFRGVKGRRERKWKRKDQMKNEKEEERNKRERGREKGSRRDDKGKRVQK